MMIATDLIKVKQIRYGMNGPLREYINERRTNETKTNLTETFLITPASIHTNKTKHQNKV